MNRLKFLITIISFLSLSYVLSLHAGLPIASAKEREDRICQGVYIDSIDISGMTGVQAQTAVDDLVNGLKEKQIAILVGNHAIYTTMGELGYHCELNHYVEQALGLATQGNPIKRYKDIQDIEHGKIIYPLTFTYDENLLRTLITEEAVRYEIAPVNAYFTRENGEFIYTDHKPGSKVDVEQTVELVKSRIADWDRLDILVEAVMAEVTPEVTKEELQTCNSILGEFTTEFKDSVEGRAANLANGARLINNAVLFPGEVFSAYDYLLPFQESNGYFVAHSYLDGTIVESVGGGACQVTTTLYNAVLFSELEIVERNAHSMTVSYVPLSMDAAIAEGSKNFKFRNNTELPILVEAFSKDRTITFRIWGHETRDTEHRKVKFVSKTVSEISPSTKDIIVEDPTQPPTYRKVTQKAKTGYKAELYKVIYIDGKESERIRINKSLYEAEPNHVTVGTKGVEQKKPNRTVD